VPARGPSRRRGARTCFATFEGVLDRCVPALVRADAQGFAALDAEGQAALHSSLLELLTKYDRGEGNGLVAPADYLEVVVYKL
jgi:hypothetical protein